MNKKYLFRIAKSSDIKNIMKFIKNHWDKNHILSKNFNFFCYEYKNKNNVNFILAFNNKKKLEGIMGFILYSKKINHVCGSIACVSKNSKRPMLGVELMKKMLEIIKPKSYCGIGTNPQTMAPLMKKIFKRHVGIMSHYYILNDNFKNYKISKIFYKKKTKNVDKKNLELIEINDFKYLLKTFDLKKNFTNLPQKDEEYLKKRYFKHPIFKYKFFLLKTKLNIFKSFLVTREINLKKRKILRIIDFRGKVNDLSFINKSLIRILYQNRYEYIDLLCSGLSAKIIKKSGFIKKKINDKNIIPVYFDPYLKKNINIWFEKSKKNLILFKGDADADRPRTY